VVLLITTINGVQCDTICRIIESCGRCRRGNKLKEYRNYHDINTIKSGLNHPIVFDMVFDNHKLNNKIVPNVNKLIIPCRPDILWEEINKFYKNPASGFFNRMTRLKEMAKQPNSMVIPYESLGTQGGLDSLQSFLGTSKKLLTCNWVEPPKEIDCPVMRRYNREINKMISLPSWYQKIDKFQS